jgi:hypothetical protein
LHMIHILRIPSRKKADATFRSRQL